VDVWDAVDAIRQVVIEDRHLTMSDARLPVT